VRVRKSDLCVKGHGDYKVGVALGLVKPVSSPHRFTPTEGTNMLRMRRSAWAAAACVAVATMLPGCARDMTPEQRTEALAQNATDQETIARAQAEAQAKLDAAKAAGETDKVKALKAEIEVYKAAAIAARAEKAELENPGSGVGSIVKDVGYLLPPPWGAVLGVGGLIWGAVERRRKAAADKKAIEEAKKAAEAQATSHAIVNSIDVAKAASPEFAEAVKKVGPIMAAEQAKTEGAHEFVEAARV
jgi:hypothetical protein